MVRRKTLKPSKHISVGVLTYCSVMVPSHPDSDDTSDDDSGDERSENKLSIAVESPSPSAGKNPSEISPFKCDICGKEFSARQPWQRHAMVHTGEKPYACTTCPARFRCTSHLKRHMRLHTGERPCQCPLCPKAYTDNPNLLRHMTIVHGCRAYECEMCSSAFALERELRAHLVDAHDVQLLPISGASRAVSKLQSPHDNEDNHGPMPPAPARVLSRRLYRPRDVTPNHQAPELPAAAPSATVPVSSSPSTSTPDVPSGAASASPAAAQNSPPGVLPVRRGRGRPKGSKNHPRPPLASPLQAQSVPVIKSAGSFAMYDDQHAKRARLVPDATQQGAWALDAFTHPGSVVNVPPLLLATSDEAKLPTSAAAAAAAANPWMAFYQNPLMAMQAQLMQAQLAHVQWAFMAQQMAQMARWAQGGAAGTENSPAVVPTTPVTTALAAPCAATPITVVEPVEDTQEETPTMVPAVATEAVSVAAATVEVADQAVSNE